MSLGLLPPAGEAVKLCRAGPLPASPAAYASRYYQSGTAALAAAMVVAKAKRPDLEHPEILIPAWGCPDLVAAANFVGLKVVVVDVCPDFHGFNEAALKASISEQCCAVLLVNYLGMHERRHFWRRFVDEYYPELILIEDNAQWWPEGLGDEPLLVGDLSITSFGRGKPVSLLGGGCLWLRDDWTDLLPTKQTAEASGLDQVKMRLFNALLHPMLYRVLDALPGLKLGATEYHALDQLMDMDPLRRQLLAANVDAHISRPRHAEDWWCAALQGLESLCLPAELAPEGHGRLIRQPLLLPASMNRSGLIADLKKAGIGATAMYAKPLPSIDGVKDKLANPAVDLPGAQCYASRMLTLPLHSGVRREHVARAADVIKARL